MCAKLQIYCSRDATRIPMRQQLMSADLFFRFSLHFAINQHKWVFFVEEKWKQKTAYLIFFSFIASFVWHFINGLGIKSTVLSLLKKLIKTNIMLDHFDSLKRSKVHGIFIFFYVKIYPLICIFLTKHGHLSLSIKIWKTHYHKNVMKNSIQITFYAIKLLYAFYMSA